MLQFNIRKLQSPHRKLAMAKSMPEDLKSFYTEYDNTLREKWDRIKIRVMVFGPKPDHTDPGAQLRKFIIEKCNTHHTVVKSEHEKLSEIHKRITGSTHNLCNMEREAAKAVDGIIILPYSAGSLVELGMFALEPDIHEKTFILFSDEYLQTLDDSFIGLGPKLSYHIGGANVEVVDYKMKELAWSRIHEFLQTQKARKYWRKKK